MGNVDGEAIWNVASNIGAFLSAHKAWRRGDNWLAAMLAATGLVSAVFHTCGDAHVESFCLTMSTGQFLRVDSTFAYGSILLILLRVAIFRFLSPNYSWAHPGSVRRRRRRRRLRA